MSASTRTHRRSDAQTPRPAAAHQPDATHSPVPGSAFMEGFHTSLRAEQILQLQRLVGNQATQRIIQRASGKLDPGQDLPNFKTLLEGRMGNLIKFENEEVQSIFELHQIDEAKRLMQDDAFVSGVFAEFLAKIQGKRTLPPKPNERTAIVDAVRNALNANPPDLATAKQTARSNVQGATPTQVVIQFFWSLESAIKESIQAQRGANRPEYGLLAEGTQPTATTLAEAYLESKAGYKMPLTPLTQQQKQQFSDALKLMPTVDWLLNKKRSSTDAVDEIGGQAVESRWRDGTNLIDNITFAKKDKSGNYASTGKAPKPSSKAYQRVIEADQMLRRMIEPQILELVPAPNVKIIDSMFFRAFQNGRDVHVSSGESMQVIVHEVSHYLEDHLPTDLWMDVHQLMRGRHTTRVGERLQKNSKDKKANKIGHGSFGMRDEGRYRGEYAATGLYTSSAYDESANSSTEVTSMTMEFLADPANAKKIIEKDPQQAAIILRNMRPQEFAQYVPDEFAQYLPHAVASAQPEEAPV